MSILGKINHSSTKVGIRAVISGVEKVGKTTMLSSTPNPLLIPLEQGYAGVSIDKVPMLETFTEVLTLLTEIIDAVQKKNFPYQSLAIDSATALERLIHTHVLNMDVSYVKGNQKAVTMDSALGGYGKAYNTANEQFFTFLQYCDWLAIYGGINIILSCHVFAAKVVDPTAGEYDTFDILLHSPKNQKTYGKREMLTQWADLIGFLHEPIFVSEGKALNKAISANRGHVIGLSRTPGYVAGNRFGVEGEVSVPKEDSWNYVAQAIYNSCKLDYYSR